MKNLFIMIWSFAFLGMATSNFAADGSVTAKDLLTNFRRQADFRVALDNYFAAKSNSQYAYQSEPKYGTKSIAKAVLFSAAIPGTGQFYTRSYLKGAAFLVIEAAALTGYVHFQNRGNDLEAGFEAFADLNWEQDAYWDWLAQISGISRNDMDALRNYEHENFSHFLPDEENQQFYENIGKYDQFNIGWKDTQNGGERDSALREQYTLMRKDANDNFKRATNLVTVALLNHVLSALDAGWTTKRYNRKVMKMSLGMKGILYHSKIVPALTLGVKW